MKTLPLLTPICCGPDTPALSAEAAARLADQFKALADPTRVGIVNRLASATEVCVCDLTATFDLSQPTVSHHLRILREAGLVGARKHGTWSYYRLIPEAIKPLRLALGASTADEPVY
jgi:ArsR family transcriptional regulator